MNSGDVVDLYRTIKQLGVELWINGGWDVDALLGEQTRPHKDLDITIQQKDVAALREFLFGPHIAMSAMWRFLGTSSSRINTKRAVYQSLVYQWMKTVGKHHRFRALETRVEPVLCCDFLAEAVAKDLDGMRHAILRPLTHRQHGSL